VIVGNYSDEGDEREVDQAEAQQWAQSLGICINFLSHDHAFFIYRFNFPFCYCDFDFDFIFV